MSWRIILLLPFVLVSCLDFFVSPNGSDTLGNGTLEAPFHTWQFATDFIRPLLSSMTSDIHVFFRGGAYLLEEGVYLGPFDSGMNSHVVEYLAYPSEVPEFSGLQSLISWIPLSDTSPVYVSTSPFFSRSIYSNINRVNESVAIGLNITHENSNITAYGYITNSSEFVSFVSSFNSIRQLDSDIEFLYTSVGSQWTESRCRVLSMTVVTLESGQEGVNITMHPTGFNLIRSKPYIETFPRAIINVLSFLTPGQGFLSPTSMKAYYYPASLSELDDMTVASIDGPLVQMRNTSNIVLRGLSFSGNTWTVPTNEGAYAPDQGGIGYRASDLSDGLISGHGTHFLPGAIDMSRVFNISIDNCTISQIGTVGIGVQDGSKHVSVKNSIIRDSSCSAIRLGQVTDSNETDPSLMNSDFYIFNNELRNLAVEYRDCSGIFGGFTSNVTISKNTLMNTTWAGVTMGWLGWNGCPYRPSLNNISITSNIIMFVNEITGDGGPIYVMGKQPKNATCIFNTVDLDCRSEIAYNYVGYALHHAADLYHDEGSGHFYTHHNVVIQPHYTDPNGWSFMWFSMWAPTESNILGFMNYAKGVNTSHAFVGNNLILVNTTFFDINENWNHDALAIINQAGKSG
jgi:hypothetical protein